MEEDMFGISPMDNSRVFSVPYATIFEPILDIGIPLQEVLTWDKLESNGSIIDMKQGVSRRRAYAFQLELNITAPDNETDLKDIDLHCKKNIESESSFTSPSFPDYYGSGITCHWNIMSNDSSYIILNFTSVDLGNNVSQTQAQT